MTIPLERKLAAGVAAAVVAGVVVGAFARLLMRLTTSVAGGDPGFSWGGTAGILTLYVAAMIPGAAATAVGVRRVSRLLLVAGAVFLGVPAVGVASEEVGDLAGVGTVRLVAVAVCGGLVFATLAVLPVVTGRLASRWTRPSLPVGGRARTPHDAVIE